jgi:hypothetical protein
MASHIPAVNKGRILGTSVDSGVNCFSSDLVASNQFDTRSTAFRITVCVSTSAVMNMTIKNTNANGTVLLMNGDLNAGTALTAGAFYTFTHEVRSGDTINYKFGTTTIVRALYVSEVKGESL